MTGAVPVVLVASLLGSLHCAAMCGGLVAAYAGGGAGRPPWRSHAAYNAGRLAAYAVLGAVAGTLGRAVEATAAAAGLQRGAALLSGLLLVAWGTHALLAACLRARPLRAPAVLTRLFGGLLSRARGLSAPGRAAALGLLSGLLPCGWMWAFAATAAGTGSAVGGTGLMAVFWAGTLPVLVGVGAAASRLAGPLRRHVPALAAAVVLVLGLLVASRGIGLFLPREAVAAACHGR